MIKHLLLTGALLTGGAAISQTFEMTAKENFKSPAASQDRVIDTVFTYLNRATGLFSYGAPDGGNAIGNGYVDLGAGPVQAIDGMGMHYDAITNASVVEILFFAAEGAVVGTGDVVTGHIYSVNADSTPNVSMGSGTITVDNFDLAGGLSPIALSPVLLSGDFVVALEWAGSDDTIGIVGSTDGDGAGEERVISLFSTASGFPGWSHGALYTGFDLDVIILPVVDVVAGVEAYSNGLSIENVYPNPAIDQANIAFRLDDASDVSVRVFNLLGEVVYTESSSRSAGEQLIKLNTNNYTAGNYYVTINTGEANLTTKFVVR